MVTAPTSRLQKETKFLNLLEDGIKDSSFTFAENDIVRTDSILWEITFYQLPLIESLFRFCYKFNRFLKKNYGTEIYTTYQNMLN